MKQQEHFSISKARLDSIPGTSELSCPVSQLNTHTRNGQTQRQDSPTFEFSSRRSEHYVSTPNRIEKSNNSKIMDR